MDAGTAIAANSTIITVGFGAVTIFKSARSDLAAKLREEINEAARKYEEQIARLQEQIRALAQDNDRLRRDIDWLAQRRRWPPLDRNPEPPHE
jgi:prefoldin subunit 5